MDSGRTHDVCQMSDADDAGNSANPDDDAGPLDTSAFLTDCQQGGASWGTPQQAGPCKSGITTYGVKMLFGPYGVRSEYNVGQGFETAGTDDSAFCNGVFIPSFGADPIGSADLMNTHDLKFNLYTVYYPGCMPGGEKFPLLTWGNGTCAMPEGYGPVLRYVASHGYIVIAAHNRAVGSGASMSKGLDFMLAQNDDASSKFYQHIDKDNIGAMGHSQGGGATVMVAANDARVKSVIIFSGGSSASKPYFAFSGDHDLGSGTDPSSLKNAVMASQQPAAWMWFHQIPQAVNGSTTGALAPGHLTTMMESERVVEETVAWWDMELKGKADAKSMFIGDSCTLCDTSTFSSTWPPYVGLDMPAHEYGHNANLN
jgi:pimeloyl-ACP methyl ester carboxylesterase